jgi:hypothetical protein
VPTTSARLEPSHVTTGDAATEKSVKEVYRIPMDTVPRSPSCGQHHPRIRKGGDRDQLDRSTTRWHTHGVDRALEVLRGAVGGEDEEERGGEDVQVAGVATAVARVTQRRGAGEERRRGRLLLLVAVVASSRVHGPRRRRKLLEAIDPRGLRREAPSRRPFIERVE